MYVKLFHFHYPNTYEFAFATRRGTWFPKGAKLCPLCHRSTQKRIKPLIIEWEPGSDKIGDFIWPALDNELVVTQKVKDVLQEQFPEVEFVSVEFWQNPKVKQPFRTTKRTKPRIWLPYMGQKLWSVTPTKWCRLDQHKSNVKTKTICPFCGKEIFDVPNLTDNHLVLDTTTWDGENIFHIHEYPRKIFCTNIVKDTVEHFGFTNVEFIEDGEIPVVVT
jgi:hypothetical protein